MKAIILIASLCFATNITSVRTLFFKETSEKGNTKLFEFTKSAELNSDPVLYAYNGLSIMRKAEYCFNPYSKLSFFKDGKKKIESAIKVDQNNPELRFIRLSVQTNIPSFLGYKSDITKDKRIIIYALKNKKFSPDKAFAKNVIKFMASSELILLEEKQILIKLYP